MCILSYLPPNVRADVDGLFNGGVNNPDGHGWAIVTGGTVLVGRSLDLTEALDDFDKARDRYPEGPALFHSRWATHGSVSVSNAHPFAVGGDPRTVVAHNGVLPRAAHPAKGDDRSDTRKFADELLPGQYRRLDRPTVQRALEQWCGTGNKLVILTADPRYQRSAYLVNERAGEWDDQTGIWHSNSDYRQARYYPGMLGECGWGCVVCEGGVIDGSGYCADCRSCQDCCEHVRYCQCWARVTVGG